MAKHTTVQTISDLSGDADATTVPFAIDGKRFEIDLTDKEAAKLRAILAPYVANARKAGKSPVASSTTSSGASRSSQSRNRSSDKRAWLVANGYPELDGKRGKFTTAQDAAWERHRFQDQAVDASEPVPAVTDDVSGQDEATQPAVAVTGNRVKVKNLTGANTNALRETGIAVESGKTWAVLAGTVDEARATVEGVMAKLPGRHTHRASLVAVRGKLTDAEKIAKFVENVAG